VVVVGAGVVKGASVVVVVGTGVVVGVELLGARVVGTAMAGGEVVPDLRPQATATKSNIRASHLSRLTLPTVHAGTPVE